MMDFYGKILNLKVVNKTKIETILKGIIKEEIDEVSKHVDNFEGLCKIFANNISLKLKENGINNKIINLLEIDNYSIDHEIVILSFNDGNKINFIVVDPTYIQFCQKGNMSNETIYQKIRPGIILENINPKLYFELLSNSYFYATDDNIRDYLASFTIEYNKNVEDIYYDINYKHK